MKKTSYDLTNFLGVFSTFGIILGTVAVLNLKLTKMLPEFFENASPMANPLDFAVLPLSLQPWFWPKRTE